MRWSQQPLRGSRASRIRHFHSVCAAVPPRPHHSTIARLGVFTHSERHALPLAHRASARRVFVGSSAFRI